MFRKNRKDHTSKEKAAIIRRHLVDQVPIADLYDEYKLRPTAFFLPLYSSLEFQQHAMVAGRSIRYCPSLLSRLEGARPIRCPHHELILAGPRWLPVITPQRPR